MDKDHIPLTIVSIIAALLVVELAWSEIARHFGFNEVAAEQVQPGRDGRNRGEEIKS